MSFALFIFPIYEFIVGLAFKKTNIYFLPMKIKLALFAEKKKKVVSRNLRKTSFSLLDEDEKIIAHKTDDWLMLF